MNIRYKMKLVFPTPNIAFPVVISSSLTQCSMPFISCTVLNGALQKKLHKSLILCSLDKCIKMACI